MIPSTEGAIGRDDLGFLLAKAMQHWNELLQERFAEAGHTEVRPSYGSILVPLFEQHPLRMSELARRSRLSKQTMTTMVRLLERDGLVRRDPDPADGRAVLVSLTDRGSRLEPVAARILMELEEMAQASLGQRRTATLRKTLLDLMELGGPDQLDAAGYRAIPRAHQARAVRVKGPSLTPRRRRTSSRRRS